MSLHQEIHFEAEICQHLGQHGWLYAEGDAAAFDAASGLFMSFRASESLRWKQEAVIIQ